MRVRPTRRAHAVWRKDFPGPSVSKRRDRRAVRQLRHVGRDPPHLIVGERFGPLTRPIALLQLQFCLALQLVFVLDAIIAGQSTNHFAALPIIDNAD